MLKPQPQPDKTPNVARALQQALECHQRGRLAEAERLYLAILAARPGHFDALHMMAMIRLSQGRLAEALLLIAGAMKAKSTAPDVHLNHGLVLNALRRPQDALASFDTALRLRPKYAEAHNNRASVLATLRRTDEALDSYGRAVALKPAYPEALYNKGNLLASLGRHKEALDCFDRALALRPKYAKAHNNRGNALETLERRTEALASYQEALAIEPCFPEALANSGNTLVKVGRYPEAVHNLRQAVALNPRNAEAHYNLGNALQWSGEHDEALAAYDRALALQPDYYDPRWNKALLTLALGRLTEGFEQYETRWLSLDARPRRYMAPRWTGETIDGTLLVWVEQGLGDQILCFGMVEEARARARALVLEVEPRLVTLFQRSLPGIEVVPAGPQLHQGPMDAQVPLGGLAGHLRRSWDAFPRRVEGYLRADPRRAADVRARINPDGRPTVGLSWRSVSPKVGQSKSARLVDFEALLRLPNCRFVDLQYGDTAAEREAIGQELGVTVEHVGEIDNTNDIDGLAALVSACDAVVTVSNTTAHLAGALGRPTFVLVPFGQAQLWCWFKEGDTSPWYPRVQLHRQRIGQPWADLVPAVADAVTALILRQ
jgi:tetratricopeptide (TPR) repeat protein